MSKRFFKRHFRALIPQPVVGFIRNRLQAKFNDGAVMDLKLDKVGPDLRCTLDDKWSFLAPAGCAHDFEFFLATDNGRAEFSAIARTTQSGGVLFDIGAHAGLVSALFCAMNPESRVFSFEPSPISIKRLEDMRDVNHYGPRMSIEPTAIGEKEATLEMMIDPAGGFVQTQRFDHSMWAEPEKIVVKVESIGEAAARLGVHPDFIKLDIEGYEYEAIRGAGAYLAEHRPTLLLEIHLNYLDERGLTARELVETLVSAGYTFSSYGGTPLHPSDIYDSPLQSVRILARAQ